MDLPKLRSLLLKKSVGRAFLGCCSLAYGAAVGARRLLYDCRVLKSHRLETKVICFGNLTTGGTGKTPAVVHAARTLRQRKLRVVVLSRGYGGKGTGITVLREGHTPDWKECGDEPWMMQQALRGLDVPILVCSDRLKAGREALAYYRPDVILLDDGFQHLALRRDLDVLMINSRDPFGGRRLLPLGDLREPIRALKRAGMVVLSHADQVAPSALDALKDELHALHPDILILESIHRAGALLDVARETPLDPDALKGRKVACFSGIADPGQFEELLTSLGMKLAQRWRFPDHHAYTSKDLRGFENARKGLPVITTCKDLARLPEGWQERLIPELYALVVKLEIVKGRSTWTRVLCEGL